MRIIVGLAIVIALAIGGWVLYQALMSDETRIRRNFDAMVESFNRRSVSGIVEHFTAEYRDTTTKIDKPRLQAHLLYYTRQGALYSFETDEDDPDAITIDVDGDEATLDLRGTFVRAEGEHDRKGYPITAALRWKRTEDGWKIRQSTHAWARGRPK